MEIGRLSFNTDSLGRLYYQFFEGVDWTLVLGLYLRDIIKSRALILGLLLNLLLSLTFGLAFWAYAPIILNPNKHNYFLQLLLKITTKTNPISFETPSTFKKILKLLFFNDLQDFHIKFLKGNKYNLLLLAMFRETRKSHNKIMIPN